MMPVLNISLCAGSLQCSVPIKHYCCNHCTDPRTLLCSLQQWTSAVFGPQTPSVASIFKDSSYGKTVLDPITAIVGPVNLPNCAT